MQTHLSKIIWALILVPGDAFYVEPSVKSCIDSMKPSHALESHRIAIRTVVERHRACNARVFGSVLYGNEKEGSDLDILIYPTIETTLFDIGAIRHELLL